MLGAGALDNGLEQEVAHGGEDEVNCPKSTSCTLCPHVQTRRATRSN